MSLHPKVTKLSEYRPPQYKVSHIELNFKLDKECTAIRSKLSVVATLSNQPVTEPLVLDGEDLELVFVAVNGRALAKEEYAYSPKALTIFTPPDGDFSIEIEVRIQPDKNTKLEGLYKSGGSYCTQCEAEGFRRLTYHLDRPDVTSIYTVRIEAERSRHPILLSNGNQISSGDSGDGRHWVKWHDPYPKPSYLFALVAGDLAVVEDKFRTLTGRVVTLRIYVEHGKEDRCQHAMNSLKNAMSWEEKRFGLEYDLDIYMIVAVSAFNMGAMENKGLNIFNDKYILANSETATDTDYANIEAIIAHEYFHNWTGNRVTLRDWFQLSLKEGLTVFRDQEFSRDVRFGAVKRIQDVRTLRARQFLEDAGPLAHPVRPEFYIEINNFYTATVYEKGAELVRMVETIVGREGFTRGVQRYLKINDGRAATVEDFLAAIEKETEIDLSQFGIWYSQAGTPKIEINKSYNAVDETCILSFHQSTAKTPGQLTKPPLHIPIRLSLLDRSSGQPMPLRFKNDEFSSTQTTITAELRKTEEKIEFLGITSDPVISALQDFSAPVILSSQLTNSDYAFLLANDNDLFNRWDAGQQYAVNYLLEAVKRIQGNQQIGSAMELIDAMAALLKDDSLEPAFKAEAILLPSEEYIANQMPIIDV